MFVISLIEPQDFDRAKADVAGFNYAAYEDYLMERYGFLLGASSAGEEAVQVTVSLDAFLFWRDRGGGATGPTTLDSYAAFLFMLQRQREL